jgi:hypothetical protein
VHSLKWHDHDGIEHLHVVRSDDLDEVLREIGMVKAFIEAARARDEKPVQHAYMTTQAPDPAPEPEPEQAETVYDAPPEPSRLWCEHHQTLAEST